MSAFGSKGNLPYEDLTLPRPPDSSHFPAAPAAAEERVPAVGLEARHRYAGRHVDLLQNLAALRIDSAQFAFVGFPSAVPQFTVDPGDAGDETVRLDGAEDRAGLRIDLMDAIPGDLVQVSAIEGGSRMRWDIERAHRFPAHRIDLFQRVAGRDPDIGAVIADPMHMRDIRKGAVFADDCRCCSFHAVILATLQGAGE